MLRICRSRDMVLRNDLVTTLGSNIPSSITSPYGSRVCVGRFSSDRFSCDLAVSLVCVLAFFPFNHLSRAVRPLISRK